MKWNIWKLILKVQYISLNLDMNFQKYRLEFHQDKLICEDLTYITVKTGPVWYMDNREDERLVISETYRSRSLKVAVLDCIKP